MSVHIIPVKLVGLMSDQTVQYW